MNGRVYDPALGRMLSADPFVPHPTMTQSFNRYSYVINNPLSFTDPSGFHPSDGRSGGKSDEEGKTSPDGKNSDSPDGGGYNGNPRDGTEGGGGDGGYGGLGGGTGAGLDMESRGFVQTGTTFTDDYETREFWAGMGGELGNIAFDFVYMVNITINPYVLVAGLYLYPDPPFDTMGPDASTARQAGAWTAIALSAVTPFGKRRAVEKVGVGIYKFVGGHHVHAKAAFKASSRYNLHRAFAISRAFVESMGWNHDLMTRAQRQLFRDLKISSRANTMREQSRIAVETLVHGGATRAEARALVAESLRNLRAQGVRQPTNIPWYD